MPPQFAVTEWYIHQVDPCNGNVLIKAWNVLAGEQPSIPPYQSNMCGHNFQSVVKIRNVDAVAHTVKYQVQVCPATQGGTPLGGPFPIPPCGQVVDSGASLTLQPGQEDYLPIWQLQMWSENIRMHNWVVDAASRAVYNCGVCYIANNWCLHPDTGYRADDWFVDINVAQPAGCLNDADCPPNYQCVNSQCVPISPVRYSCVNNQCVADPNGQYASLADCMIACNAPPPSMYSCVNGQCVPDAAGQYNSLATCQAACRRLSNTNLYIGISVIGVAAIGLVAYSQRHKNNGLD